MPPMLTRTNMANSRPRELCSWVRKVHSLLPTHATTIEIETEIVFAVIDWSKGRSIGQW